MPSALQGNMDTLVLTGAGLPATTAISGLLAVGATTIDILSDLNTSPQVTTAVNLCLREVKECRSSVHALYRTLSLLENAQVPFPARAEWIGLEELVATLTDSVLAFSRIHSLCLVLDAEAARSSPQYASKVYEKRLRALSARIRWHNLSIAMMMTIINCPGEKDAINSRDELAHRTRRLLTFNLGLASRMRRGSRPPSSSAKTPDPDAQTAESPELFPAQVGPLSDMSSSSWPTVFSGQTLADKKVLTRIALPVSLGELREDREYYHPIGFMQQTASFDYPRGGVLMPMTHALQQAN